MQKPKNIKPVAMTEEQKKEMAARAYVQKRNSIAEGIIFNACRDTYINDEVGIKIVDAAIKMADHYMEKAYGLKAEEEK